MYERFFRVSARDAADLAAQVIARGQCVRVPVHGRSMVPTLQSGDLVTVAPIHRQPVRKGDVVLLGGERSVIHRIRAINRRAGTVTTRGDASQTDDAPRALCAVIGRVVRIDRAWTARLGQRAQWDRIRVVAGRAVRFVMRRLDDMMRTRFSGFGGTP